MMTGAEVWKGNYKKKKKQLQGIQVFKVNNFKINFIFISVFCKMI